MLNVRRDRLRALRDWRGISAQAIVVEEIDRQYQQLLASLPILQQTLTKPEIQACKFQNDANLLGALYHFFLEHEMK